MACCDCDTCSYVACSCFDCIKYNARNKKAIQSPVDAKINAQIYKAEQTKMAKDKFQDKFHLAFIKAIMNSFNLSEDTTQKQTINTTDNYTCYCGNSKLNDQTDKSCWSCGALINLSK